MSFRDFLDSECGQLNPVLKVASHFTQDVTLRENLGGAGPSVGPSGNRAVSQNDPVIQQIKLQFGFWFEICVDRIFRNDFWTF